MKAVMLMFDSLNRSFLPAYGCGWTKLPNFRRLQERSLVFDNFYAGSLPCMPARRELHTGRYNLLHRSWGPLEPFDISAIERLKESGIYTHLASDHTHYWEDGGATYHTRYNTWQCSRGQEGDPWMGQVADPDIPRDAVGNKAGALWRQDWVNRQFLSEQEKMPQSQTMANGLDFLGRNHGQDNWFLQIEMFDPHEPYFVPEKFRALYPHSYDGPHLDWPDYGINSYTPEQEEHLRMEYAALLSMCDESLGRLLDVFDEKNLWDDTMLIVNTDHGFLLGEKEWMGKNIMPCYNEVAHTPFFIWDPRSKKSGERRSSLAQTVDIAPTLLAWFNAEALPDIDGRDLAPVIERDEPVRSTGMFGVHGGHVNVTDGRHVVMRAPRTVENGPLYDYTLMPTHMSTRFKPEELKNAELTEMPGFAACPVLKVPVVSYVNAYWYGDLLFDLAADPEQERPLQDPETQVRLLDELCVLMRRNHAPKEQFERLGLPSEGPVTLQWLRGEGERQPFHLPDNLRGLNMTGGAQRAMAILLSLSPPDMREILVGAVEAAAGEMPGPPDEEAMLGMLKEFLPPPFGGLLYGVIKGYLKFEPDAEQNEEETK